MDPTFMLGATITAIVVIVGLLIAVITPIIKLVTSINRLEASVINLNNDYVEIKTDVKCLNQKVAEHDTCLLNHSYKIERLEKKEK